MTHQAKNQVQLSTVTDTHQARAHGSVIDSAVVRYTAERLHAESEVLKQQRLSQQERRAIGLPFGQRATTHGEEDGEATTPPEGKAKGGRGRKDK